MEKAAQAMIERQRQCDKQPEDQAQRAARKLERLQADARQLRAWLNDNLGDRKGAKGRINLSNRTDNESAKMATSKGVIQGYTGVAAVDEKAQIIVEAQAHGTGAEQALLEPVITRGSSTIWLSLIHSGTRDPNASAATATHPPTSTSIRCTRPASVRPAKRYTATAAIA